MVSKKLYGESDHKEHLPCPDSRSDSPDGSRSLLQVRARGEDALDKVLILVLFTLMIPRHDLLMGFPVGFGSIYIVEVFLGSFL
jgi:hypothetical protein